MKKILVLVVSVLTLIAIISPIMVIVNQSKVATEEISIILDVGTYNGGELSGTFTEGNIFQLLQNISIVNESGIVTNHLRSSHNQLGLLEYTIEYNNDTFYVIDANEDNVFIIGDDDGGFSTSIGVSIDDILTLVFLDTIEISNSYTTLMSLIPLAVVSILLSVLYITNIKEDE